MESTEPNTDLITSLQLRLDELATQLYAALRYTSTHHPMSASSALANMVINPPTTASMGAGGMGGDGVQAPSPPGATGAGRTSPRPGGTAGSQQQSQNQNQAVPGSPTHLPHSEASFEADLAELAGDLVAKQREIEQLIAQLPQDLDVAAKSQEERIRELAGRMGDLEGRAGALGERRSQLGGSVESVISRFRKV